MKFLKNFCEPLPTLSAEVGQAKGLRGWDAHASKGTCLFDVHGQQF